LITKILYKTIVAILILIFIGCKLSPFMDTSELKVPTMPASISGGTDTESRTISRATVLQEDWQSEYDQFIILPEIGNNYNGWLEDEVQDIIDLARIDPSAIGGEWTEISNGIFTMELYADSIAGGSTIRSNLDFTEIEMYAPYDTGETRYLRVKETPDYTHSILIMFHAGGSDSNDSVEIIETADKKYLKCVRITDISGESLLQHFVGITDLTTSDNKTTGRRRLETNRPDFTFSTATGTTMDIDYTSQEDMVGGNYYELYGFFNDNDNYVVTDTIDWSSEGYTDPQVLNSMFAQGLNNKIVAELNIDGLAATGGIEITEWDSAIFD